MGKHNNHGSRNQIQRSPASPKREGCGTRRKRGRRRGRPRTPCPEEAKRAGGETGREQSGGEGQRGREACVGAQRQVRAHPGLSLQLWVEAGALQALHDPGDGEGQPAVRVQHRGPCAAGPPSPPHHRVTRQRRQRRRPAAASGREAAPRWKVPHRRRPALRGKDALKSCRCSCSEGTTKVRGSANNQKVL